MTTFTATASGNDPYYEYPQLVDGSLVYLDINWSISLSLTFVAGASPGPLNAVLSSGTVSATFDGSDESTAVPGGDLSLTDQGPIAVAVSSGAVDGDWTLADGLGGQFHVFLNSAGQLKGEFYEYYDGTDAAYNLNSTVGPNDDYFPFSGTFAASGNGLFTPGVDDVNFNQLTPAQMQAISGDPSIMYADFGGNGDVTTLPSIAEMVVLDWDTTQSFQTGSLAGQTYTVVGSDANYNIVLGAGDDTVDIVGDGSSTIYLGTGTDTVNITGKGANTVNALQIGAAAGAATVSVDGAGTLAFIEGAAANTINIKGGATVTTSGSNNFSDTVTIDDGILTIGNTGSFASANTSGSRGTINFKGINDLLQVSATATPLLTINGFQQDDDTIEFVGQTDLTTSALFGNPGDLGVFSNGTEIAVLNFGTNYTLSTTLEPVVDNGNTFIEVDATNIAADDNISASVGLASNQTGLSFQWSLILKHEADSLAPYAIPASKKTGIVPNSGITIAQGVDLGTNPISTSDFAQMFENYSGEISEYNDDPNLTAIYDILNESPRPLGQDALDYVDDNLAGAGKTYPLPPSSFYDRFARSVSLTQSQANVITNFVRQGIVNTLVTNWENADTDVLLGQLPSPIQTALLDIVYNYGHITTGVLNATVAFANSLTFVNGALPAGWTPNAAQLADLQAIYKAIKKLPDPTGRFADDANLFNGIDGFVPPPVVTVPAGAMTTPTPAPPPVVPAGVPLTSDSQASYSVAVTDTGSNADYILDPSGTALVLSIGSGSPTLASIEMPEAAAAEYSVSFEIGGFWSPPIVAQPMAVLDAPSGAGPVEAISVTLLGANGETATSGDDFPFILSFDSSGNLSATVTTYDPTGSTSPTLGISDIFALSNSATQTLHGSIDFADAGLTISIYDGTTLLGTTTASSSGVWNATVSLSGGGLQELTAQATDATGQIGVSNAQYLATAGGETINFADPADDEATLYDTSNDWDTVYGSNGTIYVTGAQADVVGDDDTIAFAGGSGDAASLSGTGGDWDKVDGSNAAVDLTSAQAEATGGGYTVDFSGGSGNAVSFNAGAGNWDAVNGSDGLVVLTGAYSVVTGGGDAIYFEGAANAASLSNTGGVFDAVYGSGNLVTLSNAFAEVTGGGDAVYFEGSSGNVAALYNTAGVWDGVSGSNGEVVLTNTFVELFGGGDAVYLEGGSGNALAIYNSGGAWDNVNGSGALMVLTNAYAEVTGGGDPVFFEGASGNAAAFYNSGGVFDSVTGSNGEVVLTNAQVEVTGGGNAVYLEGSGNTAALYNTGGAADTVDGSNGTVVLTNAQASVTGGGDAVYFSGTNSVVANGGSDAFVFQPGIGGQDTVDGFAATDTIQFSAADFANFAALQSHATQSGANTVITLDASDAVTLTNFTATNLVASQFHFV